MTTKYVIKMSKQLVFVDTQCCNFNLFNLTKGQIVISQPCDNILIYKKKKKLQNL